MGFSAFEYLHLRVVGQDRITVGVRKHFLDEPDLISFELRREQWICCYFRHKGVEFWTRLHQPDAILMLFVAALCLAAYAYPGFSAYRKSRKGFWWVLYLIVGILALIEWIILVFL